MNKFFLKSKTIIGLIVALIPQVAIITGFTLTPDDSAMITQASDTIIQLIGFSLSVYGRVVAKDKIVFTGASK